MEMYPAFYTHYNEHLEVATEISLSIQCSRELNNSAYRT